MQGHPSYSATLGKREKKTPLTDWGIKGLGEVECMGVIRGRTRSVGTIFFIQVLGKIWLGRLSIPPTRDTVAALHRAWFMWYYLTF